MMKSPNILESARHQSRTSLAVGAVSLALTISGLTQDKPYMQGGTAQPAPAWTAAASADSGAGADAGGSANAMEKFFNDAIPDAISQGKLNLNVRLRYEQLEYENVPATTKESYVPTLRTRLGYTTAPLYGFQAMLEGVNVSVLGPEHNYNAAGTDSQGARPSVGDPPMTRLDQAWVGYSATNYVDFSAKVGQQQINLDNQRFVGDAGWRQNMQTYEAVAARVSPLQDLNLYYGYIWDMDRVYGDVSGLAPANQDFDSHSHLINLSYGGWEYGRFTGYAYLLDLSYGAVAADKANSCATYGGSFAGAAPVAGKFMIDYRAEFAWQEQYADSPLRYSADYYNVEMGGNMAPFAFGGGDELLGSGANSGKGGGRVGFKTPLASPHPFNGWAEVFVAHPNNGLNDLYGYAQVTLPWHIPLRFVYHKYDADFGSGDYGQEFDALISKKFGKHWSVMAEFADYLGENKAAGDPVLAAAHTDSQSFWAAVEFNY